MNIKNGIKAFALVLVAFFVASCTKKDDYKIMTVIGLTQELYGIDLNNEATLTVLSSGPVTGEVPFVVLGALKEGVDYELMNKSFVFDNSMEAHVRIKFLKNVPADVLLEVKLLPISFGTLALSRSQIGIDTDEAILYTFDKSLYYMTETVDVTLVLSKITGTFLTETPITFELEVDKEASTAVEGKHFSFSTGNKITVAAGKSRGTVKLKLLKEETGKDKIVLKVKKPSEIFQPGNFDEGTVLIYLTSFERLTGSWKHVSLLTYDYLALNTGWAGDDPAKLPKNNTAKDILTFDKDKLTVSMTGDLKKYFRNTNLVKKGETIEVLYEESGFPPPKVNVMLVEGTANVSFSSTKIVERKAEIGLRLRVIDGKEYLDVTIRDYEPIDFLKNTYDMVKDWGSYPAMEYYPLRYRFERVD